MSFEGKVRPSLAFGTSLRRPGREVSVDAKERPAELRKGDLVVRCNPSAKSGHPWLVERRKGDLVVRCHVRKRRQMWLPERRKGDLVVRCHPPAKSGHPWHAERRKGDLVVRCQSWRAGFFIFFGLRSVFHFRFISLGFENFPAF